MDGLPFIAKIWYVPCVLLACESRQRRVRLAISKVACRVARQGWGRGVVDQTSARLYDDGCSVSPTLEGHDDRRFVKFMS